MAGSWYADDYLALLSEAQQPTRKTGTDSASLSEARLIVLRRTDAATFAETSRISLSRTDALTLAAELSRIILPRTDSAVLGESTSQHLTAQDAATLIQITHILMRSVDSAALTNLASLSAFLTVHDLQALGEFAFFFPEVQSPTYGELVTDGRTSSELV